MAYIPNSGSVAAWLQSDNASVITVGQGSIATVIVGGSIAASFTPPANQSVSGTVNIVGTPSISGAVTVGANTGGADNNSSNQTMGLGSGGGASGGVLTYPAVFNGTNWDRQRGNSSVGALVNTGTGSVVTVGQGSVATVIIGGSISATFTPPANQSVSGTIDIRNNSSVISYVQNSIAAVIIGGSVAVATGNSSVQLLTGTAYIGSVAGYLQSSGGSVITVLQTSSLVGVVTGSIVAITNNASVITVQQGSIGAVIIGGSIAASFTPPANQSVSGTVDIGVASGSVAAFLKGNASVITVAQGSVAVAIVSGSIAATFTPPANQSVSGTVGARLESTNASVITVIQSGNASVTGTMSVLGTVPVTQATASNPWIITGSIQGGGAGTQYIENAITPSVTGNAVMFRSNHSSSIMTVVDPVTPLPVYGSVSGTVTALQGTTPWLTNQGGSVVTVFQDSSLITINKSSSTIAVVTGSVVSIPVGSTISYIQNSVAAVIIGGSVASQYIENAIVTSVTGAAIMFRSNANTSIVSVVSPTNPLPVSVQGTVNIGTIPGSTFAVQGTTPWLIGSVYGNIAGSVVAFQGTAPWAVSTGGSVITVLQSSSIVAVATGSVISVPSGSVITVWKDSSVLAVQSGTNITSIAGILENTIQTSTAGVPILFRGNTNTSILSIVSSLTPLPISGASFSLSSVVVVAGSIITVPTGSVISIFQSSSLIAINAGSVVALSSGSVITLNQGSSIIAIVTGSVASAGAQATSIYGMRSDALSSFLGVDKTIRPIVTDDVGRTLTKPFAGEQSSIISYVGSTVSGSVQLIAASIAGQRAYITDFWLSNTGATTTLVTFQDGTTSIMGQFIAPTGGGMSSPGLSIPLKSVSSVASDVAFKVSPSTSILYVVVKGYYAP